MLKKRTNAIDELINGQITHTSNFEKLKKLLHTIPDIEKALCHIFYKRVGYIYSVYIKYYFYIYFYNFFFFSKKSVLYLN